MTSRPPRTQAQVDGGRLEHLAVACSTKTASCAPAAAAARSAAMFTAYDVLFTPPSSHGASVRRPAGTPSVSVTAETPCSRAAHGLRRAPRVTSAKAAAAAP